MHRYFFNIYSFSLSSWRISVETIFDAAQNALLCKTKKICRIFVPVSVKTCFHATNAAENAGFMQ